MGAVVGCDFLVEVELGLRNRVIELLEYCYRRIVTIRLFVRLDCGKSRYEVTYTTRFQWQESRACRGFALDSLLAHEQVLDDADISNSMPTSVCQQ